jgi:hypothetical protein
MRKSGMALGLVVAMCAFGVFAAPALAFGKFYAEIKGKTISEAEPGTTKGAGTVEKLRLGPYNIECPALGPHGGHNIRSKSKIVSNEPSESFFQEVEFKKCTTVSKPVEGGGIEEVKEMRHLTLGMEFLSNFSGKVGEGESEIRIKKPSSVEFNASGSKCVVVIPEQSIPLHAQPNKEYEAAVPETEEEELTNPKAVEKYGEFRKRLAFAIDLKRLKSEIKPNAKCRYNEESEEGKFNPETGYVEWGYGSFEGTLEAITLKEGNVWFEE